MSARKSSGYHSWGKVIIWSEGKPSDETMFSEKEKYMEKTYCEQLPLAIASVPMQQFQKLYPPEVALDRGTMFDELYLPFEGKESRKHDE